MPTEPRTHGPRAAAKRDLIAETALRAFAERGYQGTKVEDVAAELAISKGSVFQHFGSKAGLFLAAFHKAVEALPPWLDAPDEVKAEGFWSVLFYWLERTQHLEEEDWASYRVTLIGTHGTDLDPSHGDQPVPGQRGPVRDARVRGVRDATRRPAGPTWTSTWRPR